MRWMRRLRQPRTAAVLVLLLTALLALASPSPWGLVPAARTAAVASAGSASVPAVGAPPTAPLPAGAHPKSHWATLDGRRVIEIRVAAGAQKPADLARRVSRELRQWVDDPAVRPGDLVVEENPPYWMVSQRLPDGSFTPRLAVDERAARSFGLSQQALAEQYRDQLQAAIRHYRNSHSLESWLRGTALAGCCWGCTSSGCTGRGVCTGACAAACCSVVLPCRSAPPNCWSRLSCAVSC